MINELKELLKIEYASCFCSIREIAKDDKNEETPLNDNFILLNFDEGVVKNFFKSEGIKTVDTVDIQGENINLIEFKNGIVKKEKDAIKLKGIESILILFQILKTKNLIKNFKEIFDYNINYYVVLNSEKNEKYFNITRGRLDKNEKLSRLYPDYQGTYFKRVEILSFEQFSELYLKKYYSN